MEEEKYSYEETYIDKGKSENEEDDEETFYNVIVPLFLEEN